MTENPTPEPMKVESRYVAFLDILGWGQRVQHDFNGALALYGQLIETLRALSVDPNKASIRMFSDSFIVVSADANLVLSIANALSFVALNKDCLLRGGIAFGRHSEAGKEGALHVVSEPLVVAARIEKTILHPCVGIHRDALPPNLSIVHLSQAPVLLRSILYYDGHWIVNPFNIMWYRSAGTRAVLLRQEFPNHSEKYDWFLRLYDAVERGERFLPDADSPGRGGAVPL